MTANQIPKSNKNLVVKGNRLMEAKFQFKLWEMRIFEQMVSMINKNEKEFKLCKIYIKDLMKFFNSRSNNDHLLIKNAANSLGDKKLHVSFQNKEGHKRWAKLSIFPTVSIPDSESREEANAYIELEFHKDLKPYLLELQESFKSYDIRNFRHLKSVYSLRMFILLKQYEVIGKRKFLIEDLKEVLGIGADQYKLYGDFKKRVIIKPQTELSKYCDISFSFTEHKEGRKVVALTFFILPNQPQEAISKTPIIIPLVQGGVSKKEATPLNDTEIQALYALVKDWVNMETLRDWVRTYSLNQVKKGIEYTLNKLETGTKIDNVGGYLRRMVAQENLKDPKEERKVKQAKERQKVKETQQQKEVLEAEYKQLLRELSDKENVFVDQLFEAQPSLKEAMIEKAKSRNMSGYNHQKTLVENLQSPSFLAAVRSTTIEAHRSEMEELYAYYQPLINKAKKTLGKL